MTLELTLVNTPVGPMALWGDGDALVGLSLDGEHGMDSPVPVFLARHLGPFTTRPAHDTAGAATRLHRYFHGDLRALDEQPVRMAGTAFQRAVWEELRRIGAGRTVSYSELAARLGRPRSVRAVAAANAANPVALFVPCHRVIGANGTLWGYGGGLPMKEWLLSHEGAEFVPIAPQEVLPL